MLPIKFRKPGAFATQSMQLFLSPGAIGSNGNSDIKTVTVLPETIRTQLYEVRALLIELNFVNNASGLINIEVNGVAIHSELNNTSAGSNNSALFIIQDTSISYSVLFRVSTTTGTWTAKNFSITGIISPEGL